MILDKYHWPLLLSIISLFFILPIVQAQTPEPPSTPIPANSNPIPLIHIVQEGENLTIIATNFGITIEELLAANDLTNADMLSIGQQLIIPGREGEPLTTTYTVQAGDTLRQIAALFNTTLEEILASNNLINPYYQPIVGDTLTVVSRTGSALSQSITGSLHIVQSMETMLIIAAKYQLTPAAIGTANNLSYPYYLFPGQRLRIPSDSTYVYLPGEWRMIQLRPLPIQQGSTISIYVENALVGEPSGNFAGQPLHFFSYENGYVALVGIDAFTEPGLYDLNLAGTGEQPWFPFQQKVRVNFSEFERQNIPLPDDPITRQEENDFLATIYQQTAQSKMWDGLFHFPVTTPVVTGAYGAPRSYDGGPINGYHTGVDMAGSIGTPILAPANGEVVFTGLLTLRGNIVILDHGLGVMTAYFHLSEIFVEPGDKVVTGQSLGAGGSTGLSTGPHLHWEVIVNNVPVNGVQWTEQAFP